MPSPPRFARRARSRRSRMAACVVPGNGTSTSTSRSPGNAVLRDGSSPPYAQLSTSAFEDEEVSVHHRRSVMAAATVAFSTSATVPRGAASAVSAACSAFRIFSSRRPAKYSASGCASHVSRHAAHAWSTGSGAAPKLPWLSRATPGAWWAKSLAKAAAAPRRILIKVLCPPFSLRNGEEGASSVMAAVVASIPAPDGGNPSSSSSSSSPSRQQHNGSTRRRRAALAFPPEYRPPPSMRRSPSSSSPAHAEL
mmetsp:Transcript_24470/g.97069  ORF Transcript_24470/g.97069 Transcript_24470/m.97069 type:complete len:252 (-) Transcript_24470:325-1080(-)